MSKTKKKEIIDFLKRKKINCTLNYGHAFIQCCALGDNFYDYGEECPTNWKIDDEETREFLQKNSNYIHIVGCEDCCACAGW